MSKIIIHNRANISDKEAVKYASIVLDRTIHKLENVGSAYEVEFASTSITAQIIKRETGYTIVIERKNYE